MNAKHTNETWPDLNLKSLFDTDDVRDASVVEGAANLVGAAGAHHNARHSDLTQQAPKFAHSEQPCDSTVSFQHDSVVDSVS